MPSLLVNTGYSKKVQSMMQNTIITPPDETYTDKGKFGVTMTYDDAKLKYGKYAKYLPTSIIGSPMEFSPLSDPNSRVYAKMFLEDLSIIKIHPGLPVFNKKLKLSNLTRVLDTLENATFGLIPSISSGDDVRFIKFQQNLTEYKQYCNTLMAFLRGIMATDDENNGRNSSNGGIEGRNFDLASALGIKDQEITKNGLCFFCNKATTASETFDNSYGPSNIANTANQKAGEMRELRQMKGMIAGNSGLISQVLKQLKDLVTGIGESLPVFGGLIGNFSKVLDGSQLYFPDIWSDSTMGRDYTVSVKLYSPAGDSESIWRNIFAPVIALMCLALPRSDGIYGYTEPFLVKICVPGWFQSDCAVITSLEIKKGGDDNLWTNRGFPNEIEVNLTIKDLYPQMSIAKNNTTFKFNKGLLNYLECMAGLDPYEVEGTRIEAKGLQNVRRLNLKHTFTTAGKDRLQDFMGNYGKFIGGKVESFIANHTLHFG